MHLNRSFDVKIADLYLTFYSKGNNIVLDQEGTISYYRCANGTRNSDYYIEFNEVGIIDFSEFTAIFVGELEENESLNYDWYVYNVDGKISIYVVYHDHAEIESVCANVSSDNNKVDVSLCLKQNVDRPVIVDPLIHPLGSLLMLYFVHWKQGLLIHASAILNNNKAYLFTGVSGIGKSTMARLWKESGSVVLNDDRLVVRLLDNEVKLYNNPMPYYTQKPKEGNLQKIFLLKQSSYNYITPLKGVTAFSRVLGNFIQQFYNRGIINRHLEIVEKVIEKVEVYELGFKPDQEIVKMIKNMDTND